MYVNFDQGWVEKAHPGAALTGYLFDGDPTPTDAPEGFSVLCNTELVDDQRRIRFENTFRLFWTGEDGKAHKDWFGKTSVYFDDYLNVSEEPRYSVVAPLVISMTR